MQCDQYRRSFLQGNSNVGLLGYRVDTPLPTISTLLLLMADRACSHLKELQTSAKSYHTGGVQVGDVTVRLVSLVKTSTWLFGEPLVRLTVVRLYRES